MPRHVNIQQHPNQESKSGTPPYASPVKKNFSTNEPLSEGDDESVVRGVESEYRDAALNRKSKKATVLAKMIKKIKKR
jgi:hypothetical protein